MVTIILKSGYEIVAKDASIDKVTDVILRKNDFLTIGKSSILTSEIAAVLETPNNA